MLYRSLLRPLLFRFDPETVHDLALGWLASPVAPRLLALGRAAVGDPVRVFGLEFRNPLGVAAGLDKEGRALEGWRAMGFGFAEVGTVTARPQAGNPRPRIFRHPRAEAIVNRMGFPNGGAAALGRRLALRRRVPGFPVGISIGLTRGTPLEEAPADYVEAFRAVRDAADFVVVNVSSPNTPGLRRLEEPALLDPVLAALLRENAAGTPRPILVKVSPDLAWPDLSTLLDLCVRRGVAGIVATNTSTDRGLLHGAEEGGVSGRPLARRATEVIRFIRRESAGRLPIVGVGGVFDADGYLEKRDAGASLVQLYTGLVYRGPGVVRAILEGAGVRVAARAA